MNEKCVQHNASTMSMDDEVEILQMSLMSNKWDRG